uniref:Ubiquitin-like protease family profile domain-containing protein n=1 Tax=Aegilops tauschii TaxID=37682 RepID=M8BNV2_AEGTA
MVPVLECADINHREGGRYYWVFNVNLRDERFEVLDSSRKLENIEMMNTASTIAGAVRQLCRKHYPKYNIKHFQIIDIDVPKQLGNCTSCPT